MLGSQFEDKKEKKRLGHEYNDYKTRKQRVTREELLEQEDRKEKKSKGKPFSSSFLLPVRRGG